MREIVTREDEIIYADCTNVIIERDTRAEITRRLENYDIIARTRNVEINWDAAKYQQRKKGNKERSTQLQRPLTKIKIGATEKIIGKEIATQKTGRIAISGGFRKSGNTRWAFVRVCVCVCVGSHRGGLFRRKRTRDQNKINSLGRIGKKYDIVWATNNSTYRA